MAISNKNSISWQAPEFKHYEKNFGWYVTLVAILILVIAFFILQKDIFAAISIGIIGVFIIFFSRHKPSIVNVELNHKNVHFGNIFFPYKQLKYFWVVHNENHKTVNFHTTTYLNNVVILELEDQDPDEVRDFLLNYLPEHEETRETSIQRIMHKLKFWTINNSRLTINYAVVQAPGLLPIMWILYCQLLIVKS